MAVPRRRDPGRPGPKASLSVDAIVDAAIALADEASDASVSLRAVAGRLGCTPMALYTYVADRRELLDLMYDRVHAGLPRPAGDDWQERVGAWSAAILECYLRHPWVVEVSFARSVLGPTSSGRWSCCSRRSRRPARCGGHGTRRRRAVRPGALDASTIADARRSAAASDERAWWAARTAALAEVAPDFAQRFPYSVALAGGTPGGDEAERVAWTTPGTDDDVPWLEQPARDAFARAVAMLLDGAAASAARRAS